jgi:hypothetical protein
MVPTPVNQTDSRPHLPVVDLVLRFALIAAIGSWFVLTVFINPINADAAVIVRQLAAFALFAASGLAIAVAIRMMIRAASRR